MIKSLHLKCFRKVEDEKMVFTEGLNLFRGPNESSKTTRLEAIAYAFFGTKALRTPLAETVTWGKKESSLSVRMEVVIEGKTYTFTRSKGGAECNYDGGKVTGQGEVTDFASNLLGADAKTAAMLMLSSQSGLRGALDDGPAAVSALMGKLADFDLIDRVIALAQSKLLVGSDEPLRERLAQARVDLEALPVVDPQVWKDHEERRRSAQVTLNDAQDRLVREVQPAWQKTLDALNVAVSSNTSRRLLVDKLAGETSKLSRARADEAEASKRAQRVQPELLAAAREAVEAFRNRQALAEVRDAVSRLGAYPEVFWEGPKDSFDADLGTLRADNLKCGKIIQNAKSQITALRKQVIKSGKCPTCGHDAGNDDHVLKHNAGVEAEIKLYQEQLDEHQQVELSRDRDIKGMEDLERRAKPWVAAATRYLGNANVRVDEGFFPPKVTWIGGEIDLSGKVAEAKLRDLQAADAAAVRAEGEVKVFRQAIATHQEAATNLEKDIAKLPEVDVAPLQAASNEAFDLFRRLQDHISAIQSVVLDAQVERDRARDAYQQSIDRREVLLARARDLEQDIKSVNFNNTLLKKLRAVRPIVTDHLWNTVLSAVSNFFSKLRGENSVVTKDASGFRVNGQNVESLSGSTLDVLALAIRVALTKTFIPHASFLVLDEPAHGCDAARTGNVLGFLASVGFAQTLLASHDELSEAVADKVVALEN